VGPSAVTVLSEGTAGLLEAAATPKPAPADRATAPVAIAVIPTQRRICISTYLSVISMVALPSEIANSNFKHQLNFCREPERACHGRDKPDPLGKWLAALVPMLYFETCREVGGVLKRENTLSTTPRGHQWKYATPWNCLLQLYTL